MVAQLRDLTGTRVGEYEVTARLGVGGMGVVYEGVQPLIGKRVAVKVLLPHLSAEPDVVERFLAEARAVNAIRHRGIVDIFSFGQLEDGSHYFVMELLDGAPFDRLVKERAPVSTGEALWWMEETLDALDAAHEQGIIHRDIKPSNLFLVSGARGRQYVKLLDFGIAKLGAFKGGETPQTRASVVIGTPDYMSPEQARGRPISPMTDLYALGCVLFELLTGRRPFKGENAMATMFLHVEEPTPKASSVNPAVPPELDALILWMMEKDPARRPQTAEALRQHVAQLRAKFPNVSTDPAATPVRESQAVRAVATPMPAVARAKPPRQTPEPTSGSEAAVPRLPEANLTRLAPLTVTVLGAALPAAVPPVEEKTRVERPPSGRAPALAREEKTDPERRAAESPRAAISPLPAPAPRGSAGKTWALLGALAVGAAVVSALVLAARQAPNAAGPANPGAEVGTVTSGAGTSPAGTTAAGTTAVGTTAVGTTAVGTTAVGTTAAGTTAAGTTAAGTTAAGTTAAGTTAAGTTAAATTAAGTTAAGTTAAGTTAVKPALPTETTAQVPPTAVKASPTARPPRAYSDAQLQARLARLQQKLAEQEAGGGSAGVLRQLLQQAGQRVSAARTADERKEAWQFMDELGAQLGR